MELCDKKTVNQNNSVFVFEAAKISPFFIDATSNSSCYISIAY